MSDVLSLISYFKFQNFDFLSKLLRQLLSKKKYFCHNLVLKNQNILIHYSNNLPQKIYFAGCFSLPIFGIILLLFNFFIHYILFKGFIWLMDDNLYFHWIVFQCYAHHPYTIQMFYSDWWMTIYILCCHLVEWIFFLLKNC